ncbi:MAG TPA: hypothetical protein VN764_00790 [Polyangiaceae bacterium]|nr:hypothetical protein [Polyangiaceae bacterium]
MSTYPNSTKEVAIAAVVALADGGTLRLRSAANVTLADIDLAATAFDTDDNGLATARGGDGVDPIDEDNPLTGAGAAAGNVDNFQVLNSSGGLVFAGPSSEITLANPSVAVGQPVEVRGLTHTFA